MEFYNSTLFFIKKTGQSAITIGIGLFFTKDKLNKRAIVRKLGKTNVRIHILGN